MIFNTIVICLIMIICGFLFIKRPPKEINSLIGYRTTMSSKNMDTWKFAHKYAGKVWIISGVILAIISCICFVISKDADKSTLLMIFDFAMLLAVIPITEIKLRKVFDKNGMRKNRNDLK